MEVQCPWSDTMRFNWQMRQSTTWNHSAHLYSTHKELSFRYALSWREKFQYKLRLISNRMTRSIPVPSGWIMKVLRLWSLRRNSRIIEAHSRSSEFSLCRLLFLQYCSCCHLVLCDSRDRDECRTLPRQVQEKRNIYKWHCKSSSSKGEFPTLWVFSQAKREESRNPSRTLRNSLSELFVA